MLTCKHAKLICNTIARTLCKTDVKYHSIENKKANLGTFTRHCAIHRWGWSHALSS